VTFEFRAPTDGKFGYECKIVNRTEFQDCSGGTYTATGLAVGTHTFSVRTYDSVEAVSETISRAWTITGIDDDGDGALSPADCHDASPAIHPGAIDVAANGVDENCDGADAPPAPVTPAAPAPTPAPAAEPTTRLDFSISYFMRARKRDTRFSTLSLKGIPSGATIHVTCTGGCPRKRVTLKHRSGTVALTAYRNPRAPRRGEAHDQGHQAGDDRHVEGDHGPPGQAPDDRDQGVDLAVAAWTIKSAMGRSGRASRRAR
jgi:hypothetical protein